MPKWESLYRMGMPRWKKNEAAVVEQRRLAFQDYLNEVLCSTTSTLSGQAAARTPAGPNCLNEAHIGTAGPAPSACARRRTCRASAPLC
jgi:hypothetical protein